MKTRSGSLQSPITRLGFGLGACFAFLSSVISGYFLTQIFLEARQTTSWPSVNGSLTRVRVGQNTGRYFADVAYQYQVAGRTYNGTRIRTSDGEYQVRDGAEQAIRGLTQGQQVPVYYNPDNASQSVLRIGAGFQEYALLAVPVALFAMGIFAFRRFWRTRAVLVDE